MPTQVSQTQSSTGNSYLDYINNEYGWLAVLMTELEYATEELIAANTQGTEPSASWCLNNFTECFEKVKTDTEAESRFWAAYDAINTSPLFKCYTATHAGEDCPTADNIQLFAEAVKGVNYYLDRAGFLETQTLSNGTTCKTLFGQTHDDCVYDAANGVTNTIRFWANVPVKAIEFFPRVQTFGLGANRITTTLLNHNGTTIGPSTIVYDYEMQNGTSVSHVQDFSTNICYNDSGDAFAAKYLMVGIENAFFGGLGHVMNYRDAAWGCDEVQLQ